MQRKHKLLREHTWAMIEMTRASNAEMAYKNNLHNLNIVERNAAREDECWNKTLVHLESSQREILEHHQKMQHKMQHIIALIVALFIFAWLYGK